MAKDVLVEICTLMKKDKYYSVTVMNEGPMKADISTYNTDQLTVIVR